MTHAELFEKLFFAKDEEGVLHVLQAYKDLFDNGDNWRPLGNNKSNFSIVKNQQSNPIAAIIEKVTNSIDAILMKQCYLNNIEPKSKDAPQSMDEAVKAFYPDASWDLQTFRRKQAENIQVIADGHGPRNKKNQYPTSVIIYDEGEGQHPDRFEKTFLSLISGNKNDIHFVQGKYNMGGSGAIAFCGKKRFQLIASKQYSGSGEFGFTLVREHPKKDSDQAKETWFEYLVIDGKIPSFAITELDLGLEGRKFTTGSIIKLYSYQFPKGYSGFAQDLNQSINEYLYNPILPALTKDTAERYPNNNVLVTDLYGLKRRLFNEEQDYLDTKFSLEFEDEAFGYMKVSCFVFKTRVKEFDSKESKEAIQKRYFKNGMCVLFSLNGQVHGHYTSEFITRSLKLNLLKNHLLIHVDCTNMAYDFRKELFMASRDRLKDGEETQFLRSFLASKLSSKDGKLAEIEKHRKQAVDIDTSSNTKELLKNFTKNMPLDSELLKLLNQTFKLDLKQDKPKASHKPDRSKKDKDQEAFKPQRFPSFFKVRASNDGETPVAKIPINGEKTIRFSTDVENEYFDRTEEPGDLKVALLDINQNETEGGDRPGEPKQVSDLFNIEQTSPDDGTIKLSLNPKGSLNVGDAVQIKVSLKAPGEDFDEIFWIKVVDEEKPKEPKPKEEDENDNLGLPPLVFAYQNKEDKGADAVSWDEVSEATGLDMDQTTVMIPDAEGDNLTRIFVNMESSVLMNFKSKERHPNEEQLEIANRKYYTSVYFHTLFLYTITKNRGYEIHKLQEDSKEPELVDIGSYLKDVFDHYYSTFILSFGGTETLMQGLGD